MSETQTSGEINFKGRDSRNILEVGICKKYSYVRLKGYSNANFESEFNLGTEVITHLRDIRVNVFNIERVTKFEHGDNKKKRFLLLLSR